MDSTSQTQGSDNSSERSILGSSLIIFTLVTPILFGLAVYFHDYLLDAIFRRPDIEAMLPFSDQDWRAPGSKPQTTEDDAVVPWKLQVSDADLDDLKDRLRKTRYGTAMPGQNFVYGFPADQLKKVVDYWLTKYDWKKQEALINKFNQFKTNIEGLNIHFVRIKPAQSTDPERNVRVTPIILLHGWPGSFFELYKLIPLLTTPQQIAGNDYAAFEVIIPSIPGYGFSDAPQKPGLDPSNIARIFHKLMIRLNLEKYFVHGGDYGSAIGKSLALMYPSNVLGVELTMYGTAMPRARSLLKNILYLTLPRFLFKVSEPEKLLFHNFFSLMRESGYLHIQATKPDTVGAGLLDSPAGLAAYILEKFSTWTNVLNINKPDGGLLEYFSLDDLLTNVMVYWVSGCIITSQRLYKETFSNGGFDNNGFKVSVPSLLSDFHHEIPGHNAPDEFMRPYFPDLVAISKHKSGGHFPAMELPAELADDIWALAKNVLSRNLTD